MRMLPLIPWPLVPRERGATSTSRLEGAQQVLRRLDARAHRARHVVVPELSAAPDRAQVVEAIEAAPHAIQLLAVVERVDRIAVGHEQELVRLDVLGLAD